MAGWLEPVGPESSRVYWIRRGLVILAVLVVIAVVAGIIGALAPRPRHSPAAADQTSHPATVAPAPATAPQTQASAPASTPAAPPPASPATAAPTKPSEPTACDPTKVALTVAGERSVKSGDETTFKVAVLNRSDVPCILDVNAKTYALTVTSGDDRIWSTSDCAGWTGKEAKDTVQPGKGLEWEIKWNTRRSQPDCKNTGDYLKPGTYVARASYPGAPGGSFVLDLRG